MPEHELAELLAEITRRIRAVSDPEQIILFGSYARGDAGPDSDIDLLVVKDTTSIGAESEQIYRSLKGIPVAVDIVVVRPSFAATHKDMIGTIIRPALRDGKKLYVR